MWKWIKIWKQRSARIEPGPNLNVSAPKWNDNVSLENPKPGEIPEFVANDEDFVAKHEHS